MTSPQHPPRSATADHCSRADAAAGEQECETPGASIAAAEPTLDRRAPTPEHPLLRPAFRSSRRVLSPPRSTGGGSQ